MYDKSIEPNVCMAFIDCQNLIIVSHPTESIERFHYFENHTCVLRIENTYRFSSRDLCHRKLKRPYFYIKAVYATRKLWLVQVFNCVHGMWYHGNHLTRQDISDEDDDEQ